MPVSALRKCANPDCEAEFKRLGKGEIYSLPVAEPQAWGLPAHVRQKVVWLCSDCAETKQVKFDQQHFRILVINRHRSRRQTA